MAETDVRRLVDAAAEVTKLHKSLSGVCRECSKPWPCPSFLAFERAVDAAPPTCDREAEACPRCSYFARYEVRCSDPDGLLDEETHQ